MNKNQQQKEIVPSRLPFEKAVALDRTLYISGQVGMDSASGKLVNTDFKAEADQVMKNIGQVLQQHGLNYRDLIYVTIYLTNMANYEVTNEVYQKYFDGRFPARVCIAVKELPVHANIEITAIAGLNGK